MTLCTQCRYRQARKHRYKGEIRAGSRCLTCMVGGRKEMRVKEQAKQKRKLERNPETFKLKRHREKLQRYKLSEEEYQQFLTQQNGLCAICKRPPAGTHSRSVQLHIDHDHDTGEVRGLLCRNCNLGIGLLQDSPEILSSAFNYLRKGL